MIWAGGDLFTNPQANQVLADTGALQRHSCHIRICVWASVGMEVVLEHRNEWNTATLKDQIFGVTLTWFHWEITIDFKEGERLRLLARADVVGEVEASLFHE